MVQECENWGVLRFLPDCRLGNPRLTFEWTIGTHTLPWRHRAKERGGTVTCRALFWQRGDSGKHTAPEAAGSRRCAALTWTSALGNLLPSWARPDRARARSCICWRAWISPAAAGFFWRAPTWAPWATRGAPCCAGR